MTVVWWSQFNPHQAQPQISTLDNCNSFCSERIENIQQDSAIKSATALSAIPTAGLSVELRLALGAAKLVTKGVVMVPGRVQSRINISNKSWNHVLSRHFSGKSNASQFSVSENQLKSLLQSEQVVGSRVTRTIESANGVRYLREIDMGRTIGVDAMNGNSALL